MPREIVEIYPGRSEAQKREVAGHIARVLHNGMGYEVETVSIAIEEIEPSRWMADACGSDIAARPDQVVRRPAYGP